MSSEAQAQPVVIAARHLTKAYRIYQRPHHRLIHALHRRGKYYRDFIALRDVSFEVRRGETVGIVGRNGSGKSTLLQLICGIIEPTSGQIEVHGRIAAILELGAGFNPDFSGRENVMLGASLLGLGERETLGMMDDIIAFSELAEFIDQPVKTYSSGMYIRLAFALAISTRPDILVIDEALAVGDEAFQRKCFGRIEQLKAGGCTLLFVSHSAGSVTHLCDHAILLDRGERLLSGTPKGVIAFYQKLIYAGEEKRAEVLQEIAQADADAAHAVWQVNPLAGDSAPEVNLVEVASSERFDPGMVPTGTVRYVSRGARIHSPRIVEASGRQVNVLAPKCEYRLVYSVEFEQDARFVNFGMMLKSLEGVELFGMTSNAIGDAVRFIAAGTVCSVEFRFRCLFLPGTYFANTGVHGMGVDGEIGFIDRILDALVFKVERQASDRLLGGFYDISEEPAFRMSVAAPGSQAAGGGMGAS